MSADSTADSSTTIPQENSTAVFSLKLFHDLAHSKNQLKFVAMRQTTEGAASQIYAVFARVFKCSATAPATGSAVVNVINITTANVFIAKLEHLPFTVNLIL